MADAGLSKGFVTSAVKLAVRSEGIYDLFELWCEETSGDERDEIVADIQQAIDEDSEAPRGVVRRPKIAYDSLGDIADQIVAYKKKLRKKVDSWGGISKLAKETGMPQPSLSRFFSTASMPRKTTLYKIGVARFEWTPTKG